MSTEVYLDEVTISQGGVWLGKEGGEVTDAIVLRDTCREGDTCEQVD